jgi:integrase
MLYRRKDSAYWWLKISVGDKTIQRSTGTENKLKAQEYCDKLKAELWAQSKLGDKPSHTWEEAVIKWIEESAHKKSLLDDKKNLRWLHIHFAGKMLQSINKQEIERITKIKASDGVKNATINRILALIRSILRKAMLDWEWIDKIPKIKLLPEPKKRVRWLTGEEITKLIDQLPDHLKHVVAFAIETGLRHSNITNLKWSHVDIDRSFAWIDSDSSKSGHAIPVPLSSKALGIIKAQIGKHQEYVFTYNNNQVKCCSTRAFRNALSRAGIEDFRFHDLRHCWASQHIQNGTPLHILQELGGWQSAEMVKRYAHLSGEHLKKYVK